MFIYCDEALSMFDGASHARRFGGAGLQMFFLGQGLSRCPELEVSFIFTSPIGDARAEGIRLVQQRPPIRRGRGLPVLSRRLNRERELEPFTGGGNRVIIASGALWASTLIDRAKGSGAKSVFRVASETDVSAPRQGKTPQQQESILDAVASADCVVTQTEEQAETLFRRRGKDSLVIRKGIPVSETPPEPASKRGVLWVGSSQVLKQPWYFLDLARNFPDEQFTMIVPPGDTAVHAYVQRQAREISNLLLIDRQLSFWRVQEYFDRAKAFVYTSEFGSHPDNTLLQAAAGGCAILSERLDPDGGWFSKRELGLCANGLPPRLHSMLKSLLDAPQACREYGTRAHQYVKESHEMERMIEEYRAVIHGLYSD